MRPLLVAVALILVACRAGAVVAEGTPADLTALVEETLARIEQALPAHGRCLSGLTITHAWELDDRAEYRVVDRTIVLRVPATAPHLEFSLAHEVAHHIDFGCGLEEGVREAFLAAQGLAPDTPWDTAESWESTPAELFATAVAQLVTGRSDPLRVILITDEAMEVVEAWATGTFMHSPSAP